MRFPGLTLYDAFGVTTHVCHSEDEPSTGVASQLEAPSGPEFGTVVLFTNVILGTSDYRCVCVCVCTESSSDASFRPALTPLTLKLQQKLCVLNGVV